MLRSLRNAGNRSPGPRSGMAPSSARPGPRSAADRIRIHPEEHETLVGRRERPERAGANERLNEFGEEHARTRARERARDDERRDAGPHEQDGSRGQEPIVDDHRGTGRSAPSSRRTGRSDAARTARRGKACEEGGGEEGRGQARHRGRRRRDGQARQEGSCQGARRARRRGCPERTCDRRGC